MYSIYKKQEKTLYFLNGKIPGSIPVKAPNAYHLG